MVSRLLFLEPGQLRRAWPFFLLYLALFMALTLADGLSLAMFVARVGADQLPRFQALAALCVMLSIAWYLRAARQERSDRVFTGILVGPMLLFACVGGGLNAGLLGERCLGLLFLGREVALALVLLHFGAYLQEYFTRAEFQRVMPIVYAGGRVGGIAGGALLERLSGTVQPSDLLLLLSALLALSAVGVKLIHRFATTVDEPGEPAGHERDDLASQVSTPRGLLAFAWRSPLLFWISASTVLLFSCRAGLTLQCGLCFEREFASEAEIARFLGAYSQIALSASLVFQLFVVGRLVHWIGLRGAQVFYGLLVAGAAIGGWGQMTLAGAIFARFVEGELRYGLRNPLAQMTLNHFPKSIRTPVRAWSLGLLIPAATLAASLGLEVLMHGGTWFAIAVATAVLGAAYFVATLRLASTLPATENASDSKNGGATAPLRGAVRTAA